MPYECLNLVVIEDDQTVLHKVIETFGPESKANTLASGLDRCRQLVEQNKRGGCDE